MYLVQNVLIIGNHTFKKRFENSKILLLKRGILKEITESP